MPKFDLAIIGAGPGGYVAAIRAAQLGMNVALIEKEKTLGGTCLNVGCIPSKALLDSSHKFHQAQHTFKDHGITVTPKLNLKQMLARKEAVVKQLTGGIGMLMKKNKINVLTGAAQFVTATSLKVGKEKVEASKIIIASGSVPIELPFAKFDGKTIVSSTEALEFSTVPKTMVVIGAGVIGLELGSVWARLGTKVTLVDMEKTLLPTMDADLGKAAQKMFEKQGLEFKLGAAVKGVKTGKTGAVVSVEVDGKKEDIKAEKVLVAVGRRSNTENLNLDAAGIKANDRGVIEVDAHFQTNTKGVYAIGDCTPGPMLAHKAEEEGIACVEIMAGQAGHVNYDVIPGVVYTEPEIAAAGLTENQAKEKGHAVNVGKFNFVGNGRALATGEVDGFIKMVADAKTDRLLGVHMVGPHVSELIAEAVSVMEFGGAAEDLARTVHAHPTLSETMKEAAMAVSKSQIHG